MSIVDDFRMPDAPRLSWANMPGAIVLPELSKDWTMADVRRLVEKRLAGSTAVDLGQKNSYKLSRSQT